MQTYKFVLDPGWRVLLSDLGIDSKEVLKRASLPGDLLVQKDPALNARDYFRLWDAVVETVNDPAFPLKLGQSISVEAFHPAFFAGLCSPNFNIAMERISKFKRLVGPLVYKVSKTSVSTTVEVDCLDLENPLPESIIAFELVFIVHFGHLGTRKKIHPVAVTSTIDIPGADAYAAYFGISPQKGKVNSVTLSSFDAERPFMTENAGMWSFFEPELRKRLSDLDSETSFTTRVHSALLELIPGGQCTIESVADKLAVSKRTLQRRLNEEETNFQFILNQVREKLARHYLSNSELSGAQISFLLGFDDPNSFFRAFHSWTGLTPKQIRVGDYSPSYSN
jgi:AraC-like DNA-binding protein